MKLPELLRLVADAVPLGHIAVIGAHARNAWAPPRNTADVDFVIAADAESVQSLRTALESAGHHLVRQQQTDPRDALPDIVIMRQPDGAVKQVDLLVGKTAFEQSALARAVDAVVAGETLRVVTREDLIVYKLLADRPRDRDDVDAVVATQLRANGQIDWEYVELWCSFWGIEDRLERLRKSLPSA